MLDILTEINYKNPGVKSENNLSDLNSIKFSEYNSLVSDIKSCFVPINALQEKIKKASAILYDNRVLFNEVLNKLMIEQPKIEVAEYMPIDVILGSDSPHSKLVDSILSMFEKTIHIDYLGDEKKFLEDILNGVIKEPKIQENLKKVLKIPAFIKNQITLSTLDIKKTNLKKIFSPMMIDLEDNFYNGVVLPFIDFEIIMFSNEISKKMNVLKETEIFLMYAGKPRENFIDSETNLLNSQHLAKILTLTKDTKIDFSFYTESNKFHICFIIYEKIMTYLGYR